MDILKYGSYLSQWVNCYLGWTAGVCFVAICRFRPVLYWYVVPQWWHTTLGVMCVLLCRHSDPWCRHVFSHASHVYGILLNTISYRGPQITAPIDHYCTLTINVDKSSFIFDLACAFIQFFKVWHCNTHICWSNAVILYTGNLRHENINSEGYFLQWSLHITVKKSNIFLYLNADCNKLLCNH